MEYLKKADWPTIATYTNRVFVINIDKPEEQLILLHRNKHDFDHIQIYVEHDQHSEKVTYYKIIEKAADTNGNLILFAEKEK
jgi:hypothetical protein